MSCADRVKSYPEERSRQFDNKMQKVSRIYQNNEDDLLCFVLFCFRKYIFSKNNDSLTW